jgi:hypothetical protein
MNEELERCLADARACADACEAYLGGLTAGSAELRAAVDLLAAPAAVARALDELAGRPPQITLAAAGLLRDLAADAARRLDGATGLADALRTASASAERLLAAAE